MTTLTDKMEGLRRDCEILDDGQYELAELSEVTVYNQAINKCIALVKAEASVVGDWKEEIRNIFRWIKIQPHEDYEDVVRSLITTLLIAEREAEAREVIRELRDVFEDTCEIGTNHLNLELDRLENK